MSDRKYIPVPDPKYQFKKGEINNPHGRPTLPPEVQKIRQMTSDTVKKIGEFILDQDREKLQAIVDDKKSKIIEVWLAKAALKGISKGDLTSLETILIRVIGRPKETLEIIAPKPFIIQNVDNTHTILCTDYDVKEDEQKEITNDSVNPEPTNSSN